MELFAKRAVLSVIDKRISRYPLCILDEGEFTGRVRLLGSSIHSAVDIIELSGDLIRQVAIEQLKTVLNRLKSTSAVHLAVKRGTVDFASEATVAISCDKRIVTNKAKILKTPSPHVEEIRDTYSPELCLPICSGKTEPNELKLTNPGYDELVQQDTAEATEHPQQIVNVLETPACPGESDVFPKFDMADFSSKGAPLISPDEPRATISWSHTGEPVSEFSLDKDRNDCSILDSLSVTAQQFSMSPYPVEMVTNANSGERKMSSGNENVGQKSKFYVLRALISVDDSVNTQGGCLDNTIGESNLESSGNCNETDSEVFSEIPTQDAFEQCVVPSTFADDVGNSGDTVITYQSPKADEKHHPVQVNETGRRKPFPCDFCSERFSHSQAREDHESLHIRGNSYACVVCDKLFSQILVLKRHTLVHTRKNTHPSPSGRTEEEQRNVTEETLIDSATTEETNTDTKTRGPKIRRRFPCPFCPCKFAKEQTLQKHIASHTCSTCGETFAKEVDLRRHKDSKHAGEQPLFVCSECDKTFRLRRLYNKHLRTHKKHLHKKKQKKHQATKDRGPKSFCCSGCNRTFVSHARLVVHERVHSGERPFVCEECGKRYVSKANLRDHMVVHREKSHLCSICGKAFASKSYLRDHEVIHTGIKSQVCNICGKAFPVVKHLRMHMLIHTGQKPFMCEECGRSFLRKKTLTEHLRIHAGVKPYVCQFCGWKFTKHYPLTYHLKSKHKDEMGC